jgi:hypothetical protein
MVTRRFSLEVFLAIGSPWAQFSILFKINIRPWYWNVAYYFSGIRNNFSFSTYA